MPMMRSKSEVLPWSTWPRKVTTGGRGCSVAGSSVLAARASASSLLFQRDARGGNRPPRPVRRPAARPFRRRVGVDVAHRAHGQELAQDVRAGTPMASEKLADRAGQLDDHFALSRRGGVGCRCGGCACGGRAGAAARRFFFVAADAARRRPRRFRFSCRCSRPPSVLAGSSSPPSRGGRPAAPRPLAAAQAGVSARRARGVASPGVAGFRAAGSLGGLPCAFFSSCLRRCSESGLLAGPAARIASGGQLDVGLLRRPAPWFRLRRRAAAAAGIGASFMAGPGFVSFLLGGLAGAPLRPRFLFATAASPACGRGHAAPCPQHAARRQCSLAAEGLRPAPAASWPPPAVAAGPDGRSARSAPPAGHERLQRGVFLVRQAGQRRALARDTRLGADIDQLLVVDLQLFG